MTKREAEQPLATPFDGLLKNLADQFATELMADLGGIHSVISCETVGGEVELVHRLTDRVWRVTQEIDGSEVEYLYHLEFESSYTASIGRRFGAYGWGLCERHGLPVRHLLWYVGDKKPTAWPQDTWFQERVYQMKIGAEVLSQTQWREIWLPGGYKAEQFAKEAPAYLLPFAALMKGLNEGLLAELQDAILQTGFPDEHKQELLVMLVFFACRSMQMPKVMEVIDMALLERNPFAQYLLDKGTKQGYDKGREEGREEGREKTLQEEAKKMRALIVTELSKILGELSLDLMTALESCDNPDTLRSILPLLYRQPTPKDLLAHILEILS